MTWLKRLFCLHSRLNCTEVGDYGLGGETRITYSNPWALFGTRETHYKCDKCGGTYWEPAGDHAELAMHERFLELLTIRK